MLPATITSRYITVLGFELHYTEAGDAASPNVLFCLHGLTRSCRDFDEVMTHFATKLGYRVVAPDIIGRGFSQWSDTPAAHYTVPFYADLVAAFLDALGVHECDWLGTSMGGLIGIAAAATVMRGRVSRLLLNDIGPELSAAAVERIQQFAGVVHEFATMSELTAFFRGVLEPQVGPQTEAWITKVTEAQTRRLPSGNVAPHYDPLVTLSLQDMVTEQREEAAGSMKVWGAFDTLTDVKVLAVRGEESTLLLADGHAKMAQRDLPSVRLLTVPGMGHAPMFNVDDQISIAEDFFTDKDGQTVPR